MGLVVKEFLHDSQFVIPSGVTHVFYEFAEESYPTNDFVQFQPGRSGLNPTLVALTANKTLVASGSNPSGIHGRNDTTDRSLPIAMLSGYTGANTGALLRAKKFSVVPDAGGISASSFFSLSANGSVMAWGNNAQGALGDGTITNRSSPVSVLGNGPLFYGLQEISSSLIASVSAAHTLFLASDGSLFASGSNSLGQLGINNVANRSSPVAVAGNNTYLKVLATGGTSYAIDTEGRLWNWGQNSINNLSLASPINQSSPIQMISHKKFIDIVASRTGANTHLINVMAITEDNTVWTWGSAPALMGDNTGVGRTIPAQITMPANTGNLKKGIFSSQVAGVLDDKGQLITWGGNSTTGLGFFTSTPTVIPNHKFIDFELDRYTSRSGMGLKADGTLWGWGLNPYDGSVFSTTPALIPVTGTPKFIALRATGNATATGMAWIGLSQDGSLYGMGDNAGGFFGTNSTTPLSPMQLLTNFNTNTWWGGSGSVKHTYFAEKNTISNFLEVVPGQTLNIKLGGFPSINGVHPQHHRGLNQAVGSASHRIRFFAKVCRIGWVE